MALAQFIESMSDKLFFTVITVADELNAYKVLETLNARGVRLSATDLLKNWLFSVLARGETRQQNLIELERQWEIMVGRLGSESFPDFLRMHWSTGIRFGIVEEHQFAAIPVKGADGELKSLGFDQSKDLWSHLKQTGYIDAKGKVQDSLKKALVDETLVLPTEFKDHASQIKQILRKLAGKLEIKNADERKPVKTRQAVLNSERLDDFKRNPQQFIELTSEAIKRAKRLAIVDGIKYQRLGDQEYYAQELFETEELTGYLRNMQSATKSAHEQVIYDSDTEATFAKDLEKNEAIKIYAKLPGWFKVPTPLGSYNPDWAVLIELDGSERLFFVVETKSSLFDDDLRDRVAANDTSWHSRFAQLLPEFPNVQPLHWQSIETMIESFDDVRHCLKHPPECLDDAELPAIGFMYQSLHRIPNHPYQVNVIRTIPPRNLGTTVPPSLIVDIDAMTTDGHLEVGSSQDHFKALKWVKDKTFFNLITKEAIEKFRK